MAVVSAAEAAASLRPEPMVSTVSLGLAGLLFAAFVVSFIREPRQLRTGVLLLLSAGTLFVGLVRLRGSAPQRVVNIVVPILALLLLVGYVAILGLLLVNGFRVVKREGRSFADLLPLLFAAVAIAAPAFIIWAVSTSPTLSGAGVWLSAAAFFVFGVYGYFGFVFLSFVFLSFVFYGALYRLKSRLKSRNAQAPAVLMLGSRIFDGKVPPLLASRLDRGIEVYNQRVQLGEDPPLMICCGGQGPDEDRAEAEAMADYLIDHGIPESVIRRETESTTTEENLTFGSHIVEDEVGPTPLVISTNDYHTFRTALLTRQLGLDATVVPAKTARYYVPAAFLREFVAIVRDYLWAHVAIVALFSGLVALLIWESLQMR